MVETDRKTYIIGAGIASLSAAVYLIQDANVKGETITVFDESKKIGGSLDAQDLSESDGYVMRGIRMFEEKAFACTFDLLARIPSLDVPGKTLREEFVLFNEKNKCHSRSRLLIDGEAIDARPLRLDIADRFRMIGLLMRPEASLGEKTIREYFSASFFTSNFWYEFGTTFSFQPWHSLAEMRRYLVRFIQTFPNIDTMETIEISPYNQYEFMVLPIVDWLRGQGVRFETETRIIDLEFTTGTKGQAVSRIRSNRDGSERAIDVRREDLVFTTLGSIVAHSAIGAMDKAPLLDPAARSAAWALWERIAANRPAFGRPSAFNGDIGRSRWTSYTVTFRDPLFFSLIDRFIHKEVTAFGGVSLIESNWLLSVLLTYRPYYLKQPEGVTLCWGYGLSSEKPGNFVKKKMSDCNGEEILTELVYHLGFEDRLADILKSAVCIPCTTPYITSLFMPRRIGDRPAVVPKGAANFAFLGQFTEIPDDVVFTVEYSVRSAQTAVYSLLKLDKKVAPIYRGTHHLSVLLKALKTVFR